MHIRTATRADSMQIAALHVLSWRTAYRGMLSDAYLDGDIAPERGQLWQQRLAEPNERQFVLLAEKHDQLVGFVCVLLDEEPAWGACLDNLHVRPGSRGQGLGRELLLRAAAWTAEVEPGWPLHLWVFEANTAARRFYERLGGEAVERAAKRMPDGNQPPVCRYLWRDLPRLLEATPPAG